MLRAAAIGLSIVSSGPRPRRRFRTEAGAARTPDIHFAPTRHGVADAMLRLADVNRDDIVYDLGSGDGRIVILAAQKYGAHGVGVELDRRLLDISRQVAREVRSPTG
jgi:cyclopropane fatty-acyl-phospholipid synthase-like methyltransferase